MPIPPLSATASREGFKAAWVKGALHPKLTCDGHAVLCHRVHGRAYEGRIERNAARNARSKTDVVSSEVNEACRGAEGASRSCTMGFSGERRTWQQEQVVPRVGHPRRRGKYVSCSVAVRAVNHLGRSVERRSGSGSCASNWAGGSSCASRARPRWAAGCGRRHCDIHCRLGIRSRRCARHLEDFFGYSSPQFMRAPVVR